MFIQLNWGCLIFAEYIRVDISANFFNFQELEVISCDKGADALQWDDFHNNRFRQVGYQSIDNKLLITVPVEHFVRKCIVLEI